MNPVCFEASQLHRTDNFSPNLEVRPTFGGDQHFGTHDRGGGVWGTLSNLISYACVHSGFF